MNFELHFSNAEVEDVLFQLNDLEKVGLSCKQVSLRMMFIPAKALAIK